MGSPSVVGIDVGEEHNGYHAVALVAQRFERLRSSDPHRVVDWCLDLDARVIAVDAPCEWSAASSSRLAERELWLRGEKIHSYATPTRSKALGRPFYNWVFNGERLFEALRRHYPLFDGTWRGGPLCFETLPHAIVCALAGRVVSTKPKARTRRRALQNEGHDDRGLPNVDFVDAALCAVTAERFQRGRTTHFGDSSEGFIVVPACPETRP